MCQGKWSSFETGLGQTGGIIITYFSHEKHILIIIILKYLFATSGGFARPEDRGPLSPKAFLIAALKFLRPATFLFLPPLFSLLPFC
jgi:hypothetical protein